MQALKKKLTAQVSDPALNTNESRGTSPPATSTNEPILKKEPEAEKPLAIRPKPDEDEPNPKRPKTTTIPSASSPTNNGQDIPATTPATEATPATPNSEMIENEQGSGIREEQSTPAIVDDNNETTAPPPTTTNDEPPSSSETPTASEPPSKTPKESIVVGSEKWKEMKRISHMEVERRRRETINDQINELARIIPTENRQKGAILRATVAHIKSLKEQHEADTKKWALEKLLTEQTIQQLQEEMEKYKTRYEKLRQLTNRDVEDISDDNDNNDNEQQAPIIITATTTTTATTTEPLAPPSSSQ